MREDFRPGQEIAGVVAAGPRSGERVVGLADWHGWAPYATCPSTGPFRCPTTSTSRPRAALPMAGATALNLIRLGGDLARRNVTVTGASGGVGVIAVQLARLAGANVTAVSAVDDPSRRAARDPRVGRRRVARPGARQGRPGGLILVFGNSSKEPSPIDFREFAGRDRVRVQSFFSAHYEQLAADNLRTLLGLVADGRLEVRVGLQTPLAEANDALDALSERRVDGKAILAPLPRSIGAACARRAPRPTRRSSRSCRSCARP